MHIFLANIRTQDIIAWLRGEEKEKAERERGIAADLVTKLEVVRFIVHPKKFVLCNTRDTIGVLDCKLLVMDGWKVHPECGCCGHLLAIFLMRE
jgi:hypothetical protein